MKLTETRGRKALKTFKIEAGELKEFSVKDVLRLRYRAKAEGWKIAIRTNGNKITVFRSE